MATTVQPDVTTSPKYASAKTWVEGITKSRWKLFSMRLRARIPLTGTETTPPIQKPVIIQRFVTGCPKECMREVLELLQQTSPYDRIWVDSHEYEGPYKSSLVLWERDAQFIADKGDPTFTLKQTVILAHSQDEFNTIVKANCSGITEAKYVWDALVIEDLPSTVEPGVTYQIGGVNRDEASGLFSYYVTKTTANTTYLAYEAAENYLELVGKEKWKSLMPDDFDPSAAGVPVPGTLVEVEAEKNEDCSLDVVQTTTTASPQTDVVVTTSEDLYKGVSEVQNVAQGSPLGDAPAAVGGLVVKNTSLHRKDQLFDTTQTESQEHLVSNAVVKKDVSVKEIIEETTDIAATALPLPLITDIGVSVTNERTPGNWFKRTLRRVVAAIRAKIAETFYLDVFKKSHSITSIEETEAVDPGFSGGGVIETAESSLLDSGKWAVQRKTDTEQQVQDAGVSVEASLQGLIHEETSINALPLPYPNQSEIGKRVVNKKTPGGFFERTFRYLQKVFIEKTGQKYTEDQFSDSAEIENIEELQPYDDTGFSAGSVKSLTSSITEMGAFRVSRGVVTAKPVLDSGFLVEEDLFSKTHATTGENQDAVPTATFTGNLVTSIGQWARNQFGKYGYKKVVVTPVSATQGEVKTEDTSSGYKKDSATWNQVAKPTDVAIANEGTLNAVITSVDPKRNRFGLYDFVTTKLYPKEQCTTQSFTIGEHVFWYAYFKNLSQTRFTELVALANGIVGLTPGTTTPANPGDPALTEASVTPSLSHNIFGLFDGMIAVRYRNDSTSRLEDSGYSTFSKDGFVYGPWLYKWQHDPATGKHQYCRLRYRYACYWQQGPDYAHGVDDYLSSKGEYPNEDLGSKFDRLGKNWYSFKKVYGNGEAEDNWAPVEKV